MFHDDHFTVYTNTDSMCCTPESNIMLDVNYSSIKKQAPIFSSHQPVLAPSPSTFILNRPFLIFPRQSLWFKTTRSAEQHPNRCPCPCSQHTHTHTIYTRCGCQDSSLPVASNAAEQEPSPYNPHLAYSHRPPHGPWPHLVHPLSRPGRLLLWGLEPSSHGHRRGALPPFP